jgi:hypothetical protein
MYWTIAIYFFLDLTTYAQAGPVHNHHKRGQLPVSVSSVKLLGNVRSSTTHVKRDLGFQGRIGNHVLLTYGDTLYSDANYTDIWRGMTSDSMAYATHNPLEVLDVGLNDQGFPGQFCPLEKTYGEEAAECAMGITNVVETDPGQGNQDTISMKAQALTRLCRSTILLEEPSTRRREPSRWCRRRNCCPVQRLSTNTTCDSACRILVGRRNRAMVWRCRSNTVR